MHRESHLFNRSPKSNSNSANNLLLSSLDHIKTTCKEISQEFVVLRNNVMKGISTVTNDHMQLQKEMAANHQAIRRVGNFRLSK